MKARHLHLVGGLLLLGGMAAISIPAPTSPEAAQPSAQMTPAPEASKAASVSERAVAPHLQPQPAESSAVHPVESPSQPVPPPYDVLLKRSLFKRSRAADPAVATTQAQNFVVRGVGFAHERWTAFIEDTAAKKVHRLSAGETVGSGRIVSVAIGQVTIEMQGKTLTVQPGQNFAGQAAPPPAPPPKPPAPEGGKPPEGGPPAMGPDGKPLPPGAPNSRKPSPQPGMPVAE